MASSSVPSSLNPALSCTSGPESGEDVGPEDGGPLSSLDGADGVLPGDDAGARELSLGGAGLLAGDDAAGLSLAADAGGSEPGVDPGAEGGDAPPEAGLLSALKSRNAALTRFR